MGGLGVALLGFGIYLGLFVAPPERFMGEVMRILYVHVPLQWNMLLCFTFAGLVAAGSLWSGKAWLDDMLTATVEVGVVLNGIGLMSGVIWAKPTWGVWWAWDPRLTFALVMFVTFLGVLALRGFVDEPDRRATWTGVAALVASVNAPLVWFSVKWWRGIHQVQSSPETMHSTMVLPLRVNAIAILLIAIWFIARRTRIESASRIAEEVPEPPPLSGDVAVADG